MAGSRSSESTEQPDADSIPREPNAADPTDPEAFVALGAVARPHGVRGEIRVHRYNPDSTLLLSTPIVLVRRDERLERMEIVVARRGPKDIVVMTLSGVETLEAAEELRGLELGVPRGELPPPKDGEWYHIDLIGLPVFDGDAAVGVVRRIATYPTIECLVVQQTPESEFEIPMSDPWLVQVDLPNRRIEVAGVADLKDRTP